LKRWLWSRAIVNRRTGKRPKLKQGGNLKLWLADHPYLVGIVLAAVAISTQIIGGGALPPFMFSFAAITLAAWLGWTRAALTTTLLLIATNYLLMLRAGAFNGGDQSSNLAPILLAAFAAEALLITLLWRQVGRERATVEENLERSEAARERAEESSRLKRDFIANMSHEIRAPLSAVLGFSDLLASGTLSPSERASYIDRLKTNAAALTHLVTGLLDVTEIDSTDFVANRRRILLADFVQKIYSTFLPAALEKGLKFQVQLRGQLPAFVESDPEQLMQILKQVIDNAIHYSSDGLIKLTITAAKTGNGRRELALIVTDPGEGISAELKKKLFRPFARETGEKTKLHSGTGLGLTIARKLARGLGGDIRLAKSNSRGSTFLITVDAGPIDNAHELIDQLTLSAPQASIAPDDPHALEGIRVLVVDDSPDSAFLVSRMLKVVGAQVETADRGLIGIEKAMLDSPDVVLMDIEMPEMDGNEAIRRLRAKGFKNPIIALSAHVMKEDQREAERSGSSEFLMKPVSRRSLLEMVGRYARLNRLHGAAPIGFTPPLQFPPPTLGGPLPLPAPI
jgi:signal transduction histidine kinase/CheY-like chemotaxis protein